MSDTKQEIKGNNNIQVGGNYITTNKYSPKTVIVPNPDIHISDSQAKEIKDKIHSVANIISKNDYEKTKNIRSLYNGLYKRLDITSYKLIPISQFDVAIKYLNKIKVISQPKEGALSEAGRLDKYKAIHAKANQLKMSKIDLVIFINEIIQLKTQVTSLKELSNKNLILVYNKIMHKK